jgi:hypothetical protein
MPQDRREGNENRQNIFCFIVDRLPGQTGRQMQHAADRFREDGPNQMYNALFEGEEMSSKDVVPDEDCEQDSRKEPDNDEHLKLDGRTMLDGQVLMDGG